MKKLTKTMYSISIKKKKNNNIKNNEFIKKIKILPFSKKLIKLINIKT